MPKAPRLLDFLPQIMDYIQESKGDIFSIKRELERRQLLYILKHRKLKLA